MRTRKMVTFSICVSTVSNLKRLKNVFFTTMISVMTSGLMTFIFWMVAQIAADACDLFSRIKDSARSRFYGLGAQTQKEEKKMKKRFGRLPKSERQKIESQYHRMKPEDLDKPMSHARHHSPGAIRLPPEMIETLKMVAEAEGEAEYQAMVRRWIEERLRQERPTAG